MGGERGCGRLHVEFQIKCYQISRAFWAKHFDNVVLGSCAAVSRECGCLVPGSLISHRGDICMIRGDVPFWHLIADSEPDASADAGIGLQKRQNLTIFTLYVLL